MSEQKQPGEMSVKEIDKKIMELIDKHIPDFIGSGAVVMSLRQDLLDFYLKISNSVITNEWYEDQLKSKEQLIALQKETIESLKNQRDTIAENMGILQAVHNEKCSMIAVQQAEIAALKSQLS